MEKCYQIYFYFSTKLPWLFLILYLRNLCLPRVINTEQWVRRCDDDDWIGLPSAFKMAGCSLYTLNHWWVTDAQQESVDYFCVCVFLSTKIKLGSKCFRGPSCLIRFFFTGGPGVHDPCEREPTDALSDLNAQQADAVTHSAQVSPLYFFCSEVQS